MLYVWTNTENSGVCVCLCVCIYDCFSGKVLPVYISGSVAKRIWSMFLSC